MSDDEEDPKPDLDEAASIPEGALFRGLRVGTALLGAVSRTAGRRLLGESGEDGARLARNLGRMKGLSMKLGQMLSYLDLDTPSGWKQGLSRLQHHSPPMPPSVVTQVILEDLGKPPEALFSAWDAQPLAAASIGQVHRATLRDGSAVAVKVRYPSIERLVQQDLKNVELLHRVGGFLMPKLDRKALMEELEERFLEECDYRKEAENQRLFSDFFESEANVVVPRVYPEHSSERVLTTTFIDGQRFDDFVRTASQSERDQAARIIHNFAFRSIYELEALNCDPHPGNYLFLPGAVAFLDFGCVRRFVPETTRLWRTMLRAALERDVSRFREAVIGLGLADERGSFDFDAHYAQYLFLIRPWLTAEGGLLTPDLVTRSYRLLLVSNPNRSRLRMPRELLFVNRLQWGLYSVLAGLGTSLPLRDEILEILYQPGEARPDPFSDRELEFHLHGPLGRR